jgi:uncharacterized repeat protein (TIGR03803 family)/autotransporter-associated beta strand protein
MRKANPLRCSVLIAAPAVAMVGAIAQGQVTLTEDVAYPSGLTLSGDTLYGTTMYGGANYVGEVFSLSITGGTPTVLASFNGSNGAYPRGGVIISGSTLYGTTTEGGGNEYYGTVFSVPLTGGTPTVLASFNGFDGADAFGSLVLSGSTLYGTTNSGGSFPDYYGTVFSLPLTGGTPTVLASFNGTNGAYPRGGLTLSGNTLYGTTTDYDLDNGTAYGKVFSISITGGAPTVLASFSGTNGADPIAGVTLSGNTLYGTTYSGGAENGGVVFSVPVSGGTPTVLATFNPEPNGGPFGGVTVIGNTLCGTTEGGGSGEVFSLPVTGGAPTVVASLGIGGSSEAGLTLSGNTFYGTTTSSVFSLTPAQWNNAAGNNLWDNVSTNWYGVTGNTMSYADGDVVAFSDDNAAVNTVTLNQTVMPSAIYFNNSSSNYTISGTGMIAGGGSLTMTGSGSLTLSTVNSYTGGTSVNSGTLIVAVSGALPANQGLFIGVSGTVQLAQQTGGETLSSLRIATGGRLDITNNHVIINYVSGFDPASTILGYLASGANNGGWNGTGLVSSTAAGNSNYGIGYADGADGVDTNLTSGEIEVAYAQYGDITLSGEVNANDFHILASNFGDIVTGGWEDGDFLYQGTVNAEDFSLLAENFGQTETGEDISMPASDWAAIDAFAAANGLTVTNNVPEPVGLIGLAGIGLLTRRRRRTRELARDDE